MVGDDAHRDVGLLVLPVSLARPTRDGRNQRLEHVGVVVGAFALQHHAEPLKAHARIDVLVGKFFQVAVGLAVELHDRDRRSCSRFMM